MKRFNICIIQPEGYIHSGAFYELGDLLYFSIKELGHLVQLRKNHIESSVINIVIGIHLLDSSYITQIPKNTIVINTEQLSGTNNSWNQGIVKWFSSGFELWDYSNKNLEYLQKLGIQKVKKLHIGYQKKLHRLTLSRNSEVDVLFYGCINQRRGFILEGLQKYGLRVKVLQGVYGYERDKWIEKSKIVLNHHFYDSQIFEVIRVFYLLTNAVAVVGEVNPSTHIEDRFKNSILGVPYEDIVHTIVETLQNENKIKSLRENGLDYLSQFPQTNFIKELI